MSAPGRLQISTLLYAFDAADRVLLLSRAREPNRGLWSPPGGKIEPGEAPHLGARREAAEELGLDLDPSDLHLAGLVSEAAPPGGTHWLMFLYEVRPRLARVPPPIGEGAFAFFHRAEIDGLELPSTDREFIWPQFWRHRGGFFAAHCEMHPSGGATWQLLESRTAGFPGPGEQAPAGT